MMSDHSPLQTPRFLVSPLVFCIDRDKHVKREDKNKKNLLYINELLHIYSLTTYSSSVTDTCSFLANVKMIQKHSNLRHCNALTCLVITLLVPVSHVTRSGWQHMVVLCNC